MKWFLIGLVILFNTSVYAQPLGQDIVGNEVEKTESPIILALEKTIRQGYVDSLSSFWTYVSKNGSPLIE